VEFVKNLLQRSKHALGLAPLPSRNDEIVSVAGERPDGPASSLPESIQFMQVDVGQQRR